MVDDTYNEIFTKERFEKALEAAFYTPDVKKGIDESGEKTEDFVAQVHDRRSEIIRNVGKEIEDFASVQSDLKEAQDKWDALNKKKPKSPENTSRDLMIGFFGFISLGLIALLVYGLWRGDWLEGFRAIFRIQSLYVFIPLAVGTVFIWKISVRRAQHRLKRWSEDGETLLKKLDIDGLEKKRSKAEEAFEQSLTRGILVILRPIVEDTIKPNRSTILGEIDAPGLAEVYDDRYKVDTDTMEKLRGRLALMRRGSIGISGYRGSGKTALMTSYCDAGPWNLGDRQVLSVMIPAPIEYNARDFILHLFSKICGRLLEIKGVPKSEWEVGKGRSESFKMPGRILSAFLSLSPYIFILGAVLLIVGFLIGWAEFSSVSSKAKDAGKVIITLSNFGKVLDVKPSTIRQFGFLLVIAGLALIYIHRTVRSEIREEEEKREKEEKQEKGKDPIIQQARKYRDQIKFQESYTSGWSGALKLPIGIETGISETVTRSKTPFSLPEIVADYRNFIKELSGKNFTVIIGIDELDKMESDEKAQRFLNDIKMIFGLDHCFYLISVSESAMRSFELRGIRFRNVFDSSFDEVVYVEYLDFDWAYELIKKRVIGMPLVIVALCYCLSGGLARDLIRTCRNALDEPRKEKEKKELSISEVCERLVNSDLNAKLRAMKIGAKDLGLERETTEFLAELREIETEPAEAANLIERAENLLTNIPVAQNNEKEEETLHEERRKLRRLHEELASYLIYSATLVQFFDDKFDYEAVEKARKDGILDRLAKAKQDFAVNPGLPCSTLMKIRKEKQMQPFNGQEATKVAK